MAVGRNPTRLDLGPNKVLIALVVAGVALRVLASLAIWPVGLGINDSAPYATAAAHNLLSDVQAPAGYPTLLAAFGLLTHQVAALIILQHLLGIGAALLFFATVKRASGSGWLALLPAGGILLGSDQIYLEHNVMAEGAFTTLLAATMYAAVRALERPQDWRWALVAGLLAGAGGLVRSAAAAVIAVVVLAILLRPGPVRARLRSAAVAAVSALLVLGGYAVLNRSYDGEFSIGPAPGWHLYGMVAHYADCATFTPPAGTGSLCERLPPSERLGLNFYLYDARSPARRAFGYFKHDQTVGAFARRVVTHEPGQYARNVALNLAAYFVPSVYPASYGNPLGGQGLSPPLDWTRDSPDAARLARVMAGFYTPFHPHTRPSLRRLLGGWERVFRFGATLLALSTIITLVALLLGARRELIVLFGGGGLCLLAAPSLIGEYSGRYTVPMVAPMLASAAIGAHALWRRAQASRRHTTGR